MDIEPDYPRDKAARAAVTAAKAAARVAKTFKAVSETGDCSRADASLFNAIGELGTASHDAFCVAANVAGQFGNTDQEAAEFDRLAAAAYRVSAHVGVSSGAIEAARAASKFARIASDVARKADDACIAAHYAPELRDQIHRNNASDACLHANRASDAAIHAGMSGYGIISAAKTVVSASRASDVAKVAQLTANVAIATAYAGRSAREVGAAIADEAAVKAAQVAVAAAIAAKAAVDVAVSAKISVQEVSVDVGVGEDLISTAVDIGNSAIVVALAAAFDAVKTAALVTDIFILDATVRDIAKFSAENAQAASDSIVPADSNPGADVSVFAPLHPVHKAEDAFRENSGASSALIGIRAALDAFQAALSVASEPVVPVYYAVDPILNGTEPESVSSANVAILASASALVASSVIKATQGSTCLIDAFAAAAGAIATGIVAHTDDAVVKTAADALAPLIPDVALK